MHGRVGSDINEGMMFSLNCWHCGILQGNSTKVCLKLLKASVGSDEIYPANEGREGEELPACAAFPLGRNAKVLL